MINRSALLKNLQGLLPKLEKDIQAYSEYKAELQQHLQQQYDAAVEAGRTAEHFVAWRAAQITQAAVAWVLTCVFVRFLEDNNLLDEPMLAGPVNHAAGGNALQQAKERMTAYFHEHPAKEERDYLLEVFATLERFPVIDELLDHRHNPLWQIPVSADGAKQLIDFFQKIDPETGDIIHDFTDDAWDTRFLGDLYQDLSESIRKRYALLQTPEFVEEFILDYTLEPAIEAFGLPGLRLIDPTCGSGHFLLTTFERVFNRWQKREPATNSRALAQRALDVVHGTDINPYAIAICRFRLLIAAMKAAGSSKIKEAPNFHFNLACGDSLLHGRRFEWQGQGNQQDMLDGKSHVYEVEDADKLNKILGQRYHVVVGNPPYITVKDKALNEIYRHKYPTCHRQYSLGVPFTERFFDLTLWPEGNQSAGFMGMITANSFMKREFGKKLIEDYLPRKDVTHVIDTSGAYIPGHGTPTVILFARNQAPKSEQIQAVLGIRGEPGAPEVAAEGKVWTSILKLLPKKNAENEYVTVATQERSAYEDHPWSVAGGGTTDLKDLIESNSNVRLSKIVENPIGRAVRIAEEDVFMFSYVRKQNSLIPNNEFREFLIGEQVRDWGNYPDTWVWYPYFGDSNSSIALQELWGWRVTLANRKTFKGVMADSGLRWYDYMQHTASAYRSPLSIAFAEIASHNHFVLDRGGRVFKQTAPVIKLPAEATEDQYFSILGLLNSSTGCFWMKQVFYPKGGDHVGTEGARLSKSVWDDRYQLAGTGLKNFPVVEDCSNKVIQFSEQLDLLAAQFLTVNPKICLLESTDDVSSLLRTNGTRDAEIWQQMVALQEELDWHIYRLYGLTDTALCFADELPLVKPGERAFEIALARKMAEGEIETTWFSRHGTTPITEIPAHWPADYRQLIEQRLALMESNPWIKLVEQPEYKRRWNRDSWDVRLKAAAKDWLLDQIETVAQQPQLFTCAQLADKLRSQAKFQQVAELYAGTDMLDIQALVSELVAGDQVPQMAAARLKPEALDKWFAWQETWDKQRQEDAIDAKYGVDKPLSEADAQDPDKLADYALAKEKAALEKLQQVGNIAVPPAYKQADFRSAGYWQLRGKLDVPKERFFSIPGAEKDGDSTLVVGWAGLNHLQRATAIASWYLDRRNGEGWPAERLMPMLVALQELIPWLKQWHNDIDPEYGERMGDYYEGFLLEELRTLEIAPGQLTAWLPAERVAKGRGRAKKTTDA